MPITMASGRNSSRSATASAEGKITATASPFRTTAAAVVVVVTAPFSCALPADPTAAPDDNDDDDVCDTDARPEGPPRRRDGGGGRPLCTHSAIAIMVKLPAISMALGRYVPMLTKRLGPSSR